MTISDTTLVHQFVKISKYVLFLYFFVMASSSYAMTYSDVPVGGIAFNESSASCPSPIRRTINVADSFTIADVQLGFNADHTYRGDISVTLEHPDGTRVTVINSDGSNFHANYDLELDDASGNAINDGNADSTSAPFYDRSASPANALSAFDAKNSAGNWVVEFCDAFGGDSGTYNQSQITITEAGPQPPVISKQFDGVESASIVTGSNSTLTIALTNPNSFDLTGAAISDTYPTGITNSAVASTNCVGGTLTSVIGGNSVTYTGGTIPTAGCTITATVTSTTIGAALTNTTSTMATNEAADGAADSADLTVTAVPAPIVQKQFDGSESMSINSGTTTSLTIVITNPNAFDLTGATISDTYPAGSGIVNSSNATTDCVGGTLTSAIGGNNLTYTGGTIPAAGCTISVIVTSSTVGGPYTNTTSTLVTNEASVGVADTADLTITNIPVGSVCGYTSDKENNWVDGSTSYSESNINGSGINLNVVATGELGQLDTIDGGSFGGVAGLDLRTDGFIGGGVTFTYTFSTPVTSVDFNIGHINSQGVGGGGDNFVITARDTLGNTIFPDFTTTGSSYTAVEATGTVDATSLTPNPLGVHFDDTDLIDQVVIVWNDCSVCGNSFHGAAIGEMDFCPPEADLSITKDDGSLTYAPGETGTYVITVTNNGPDTVLGAIIEDNLPDGVTLSAQWTCSASAGSSCSSASGGSVGGSSVSLTANILNNGTITVNVPVNFSSDMSDY